MEYHQRVFAALICSFLACGTVAATAAAPLEPPNCPSGFDMTDLQPETAAAPGCGAANFDSFTEIAYTADSALRLDVLVPNAGTAPRPLVVWVHGGGWRSGSKAQRAQAQRLVCRGYIVASIDYRLSGEAVFPAQIHDVKAAIRHLRANASTYGIDTTRIAVFGSSAGGHLAALAGTSSGIASLEDTTQGNGTTSSRVQAVVDWYGPTQLTLMDSQLLAEGCPAGTARHGEAGSAESQLLGCTLSAAACADQARAANPGAYVDAQDPPALILHGDQDCTVPQGQSELLAQALDGAGVCAVRRTVPTAGHGGPPWQSAPVQDASAEFLDRILSRPAVPPSPVVANCNAFLVTGDSASANGARWRYTSTDEGTQYVLTGLLFTPGGSGPFPGVVVSHGAGGNATGGTGYSANIARTMRGWGMVTIATNYTHTSDPNAATFRPSGPLGASDANVLRARKARSLLSCVAGVDLRRLAAHGHSMGAFVTGQLLGTYPGDFRAASHTAGGANQNGPNATRSATAANIRTPYQIHHGDADTVVDIGLDQELARILEANDATHAFITYPGYDHRAIATDAVMLERVRRWYRMFGVL